MEVDADGISVCVPSDIPYMKYTCKHYSTLHRPSISPHPNFLSYLPNHKKNQQSSITLTKALTTNKVYINMYKVIIIHG